MKIEKKLIFYIFLIPIVGMLIGTSGGAYLLNYSTQISEKKGEKFLKDRELKLQKEKIKLVVDSVINNIVVLEKLNIDIIKTIKILYPPKKDKYIFIYKVHNLKGGKNFATMLLNINRPDLEGKDISDDYQDIKGFKFRKKMLDLIRKNNEGYVTYHYKKPNSNKIVLKISYFKYYKPLNLIIASGIYLDDIEQITKNYKNYLTQFNIKIIKKLLIISFVILLLVLLFTIFIVTQIKNEFYKFRKTIALNEKKLRYKLYIDELTKLKSRKSLIEHIEKDKFKTLILIDIDNFKNINQLFGTDIGDRYLIEFANLLKQAKKHLKKSISLFRIGADEFVVTSKYDCNQTKQIALDLYTFLTSKKIKINSEEIDVDITMVYSDFPNPLKKAILTLQEAKDTNIPILTYKNLKNKNKEKEFFEIKKILKTAIDENQITPYAQPIVDNEKNIIKYELLMRIVTPSKVISPYFLDFAKKAKLYTQISSIMIDKCFEFIKKTDILCSINIDMQDITNEQIVNKLRTNAKNLNKPVVFEILESESFQNYEELKNFIREFKKYGVLFAIDDFGSGYSNYSEILELKADYLKIDGSLIKNITTSKENLILIDSILFLTNMIGIKTTAEFVENEEIFNKLKALGIDEFQGYYFDKPKPLNEIQKF